MSFIKKQIKKLKGDSPPSSSDELPIKDEHINGNGLKNGDKTKPEKTMSWKIIGRKSTDLSHQSVDVEADSRRQSQEVLRADKARRSVDKERNKIEAMKRVQLARIESAAFMESGPEEMTKLYRPFSMNQSKRRTHETRVLFKELNFAGMLLYTFVIDFSANVSTENQGKILAFRARIHTIRRLSAKLVFIVFRQQTITIQGVLTVFRPKEEIVGRFRRVKI